MIIEQHNDELNQGQIPSEINNAIIDQFYQNKDEEQILKNDETNSNRIYEDDGTDQNTVNEIQETVNIQQPSATDEDKEVYRRDCEDASTDQNTEIKMQETENLEQPSAIQNDMEESSLVCENTSVNQNTEIIEQKIDSKESVSSTQNKEEETNEIQEENDINSQNVGKDMQEIHHEETKDSNEPVNMRADEIENEQIESKI